MTIVGFFTSLFLFWVSGFAVNILISELVSIATDKRNDTLLNQLSFFSWFSVVIVFVVGVLQIILYLIKGSRKWK